MRLSLVIAVGWMLGNVDPVEKWAPGISNRQFSFGRMDESGFSVTDGGHVAEAQWGTDAGVLYVNNGSGWQALSMSGRRALVTCAAGTEGWQMVDVLSGAATGKRTKLCLCTSNGSSAYAWQNVATATIGSSTTCGSE